MKKLSLTILAVAALLVASAAVGYLATAHYQNTKTTKTAPTPVITVSEAESRVEAVKDAEEEKYQQLVDQFNAQVAECQKGLVAYDKLTPFNKTQTPAPVCAAALAPVE